MKNPILAINKPTPLQQIFDPCFETHGVSVYIKREDLLHPIISGNKWHKLKYNIEQALREDHRTLISFGGAYSNHLHALAYAGKLSGLQTIGVVRGELTEPLNATLQFATDQGMLLHYVNRSTYRNKASESFLNELTQQYGRSYIIPEGGCNRLAVKGCSEIIESISEPFDVICCACGTGGTLAGLVLGLAQSQRAIGFSVLKAADSHQRDVAELLAQWPRTAMAGWQIQGGYHFGGYAKVTAELIEFVLEFEQAHGIAIEPIYTGKMLYGLFDLIQSGMFKRGERIVALHSGGLQGRDSAFARSV